MLITLSYLTATELMTCESQIQSIQMKFGGLSVRMHSLLLLVHLHSNYCTCCCLPAQRARHTSPHLPLKTSQTHPSGKRSIPSKHVIYNQLSIRSIFLKHVTYAILRPKSMFNVWFRVKPLSGDEAQDLLLDTVAKRCCHGSSAAREMTITKVSTDSAFQVQYV